MVGQMVLKKTALTNSGIFSYMKKIAILSLLVFALVLSMSACRKNVDEDLNSSLLSSSNITSTEDQDDADDMTSSELDEVAKDFVDNANPSIIVTPNTSGDDSSNPSSSDSSSTTNNSIGNTSTDTSSDTTSSSKPSSTVPGYTPFL